MRGTVYSGAEGAGARAGQGARARLRYTLHYNTYLHVGGATREPRYCANKIIIGIRYSNKLIFSSELLQPWQYNLHQTLN